MNVSNWRPMDRGMLQGFFDLTLPSGMVLKDCSLFSKGDQRWVNTPQKSHKFGEQTRFTAMVEFVDRETRDKFNSAAVAAFDQQIGGTR